MTRLNKTQSRRYIREHFALHIFHSDLQFECPDGVEEVWDEEIQRIAKRMAGNDYDFSNLEPEVCNDQ